MTDEVRNEYEAPTRSRTLRVTAASSYRSKWRRVSCESSDARRDAVIARARESMRRSRYAAAEPDCARDLARGCNRREAGARTRQDGNRQNIRTSLAQAIAEARCPRRRDDGHADTDGALRRRAVRIAVDTPDGDAAGSRRCQARRCYDRAPQWADRQQALSAREGVWSTPRGRKILRGTTKGEGRRDAAENCGHTCLRWTICGAAQKEGDGAISLRAPPYTPNPRPRMTVRRVLRPDGYAGTSCRDYLGRSNGRVPIVRAGITASTTRTSVEHAAQVSDVAPSGIGPTTIRLRERSRASEKDGAGGIRRRHRPPAGCRQAARQLRRRARKATGSLHAHVPLERAPICRMDRRN